MTIEKLNNITPDLTKQNIARIAEFFPECVTEGPRGTASDRGEPVIDFDLLRQTLADHLVEGPQERYRLDWPGKREALMTAYLPIDKTLRPMRDESVGFDTTRNLFIEGDNLDALKLLQETYLGKVKMIYIDPPYNTGKDFIYKDNFTQARDVYEAETGQRDEGERLVANPETNGRFHSDWISMMYPRLKLARNLLRDDGILFISISGTEQPNARKLCESIFGEGNVIGMITWKARVKPVNVGDARYRPQQEVDYVLIIQKAKSSSSFYPLMTGGKRQYPHNLNGRSYRLATILKSNRGVNYRSTMSFSLGDYSPPDGQRWQAGEDVIKGLEADGYLEFREGTPFRRYFEDEEGAEHDPFYCFMEVEWSSTAEAGKHELNALLGEFHGFDTVKPVRLIQTLISSCTAPNDEHLILDFFVGSGTAAHATMKLNAEDGGNRTYIAVQAREPSLINEGERAPQFEYVSDLARERIRRAGAQLLKEQPDLKGKLDTGFRAFRIDSGNFADARVTPSQASQAALAGMISHIRDDRSDEDLLFGALLRWGVDITLPVEKRELAGRTIWLVDPPADGAEGAALVACFARPQQGKGGMDTELADAIARMKPLRVLFRDDGFTSDAVMENVQSRFKQLAPDTDVKVL
jgi:adenine-specific DNA-methyltransferase